MGIGLKPGSASFDRLRAASTAGAVLILLFLGSGARAGTLEWAGTLFVSLGQSQAVAATGTGVATVNGSGGFGHLTTLRLAGGITAVTVVPFTDPSVTTVTQVTAAVTLGTGTLAPISGGGTLTSNTLPVQGQVTVCAPLLGIPCVFTGNLPLTASGTRGVGIGGGAIAGSGFISLVLTGNPWTLGVATTPSTTATAAGFVHGPASGTSSTAAVGGAIQLVTPATVTAQGTTTVPVFTALRLRFVPEPAMALLLASGVGALAWIGSRRQP
jgi:hypothetical protein